MTLHTIEQCIPITHKQTTQNRALWVPYCSSRFNSCKSQHAMLTSRHTSSTKSLKESHTTRIISWPDSAGFRMSSFKAGYLAARRTAQELRNWGTEELTRSADMWRLWSCRLLHQVAHLSPTKKEDKNKTLQQRMLGCGVAGVGDIGEVVRLITEIANGYWHDFECSTHAQIVHLLRSDMFTDVIWT